MLAAGAAALGAGWATVEYRADEQRRADAMLDAILPVSARRLGLLKDSRLTTNASRVALESISAPTLCISARDDGYGTTRACDRHKAPQSRQAGGWAGPLRR